MVDRTLRITAALSAAAVIPACDPEGALSEKIPSEAERLVDRSIAFHDPNGLWADAPLVVGE